MDAILQLYLVWIIAGIVLMLGYAYLGTSFVFWVAGGLAFVALSPIQLPDLSNLIQVSTWIVVSILYLLAWYIFLKPFNAGKRKSAIRMEELIGETGKLVESSGQTELAKVKFPNPVHGSSSWPVIPLGEMEIGDQVVVVDTVGQSLVVRKSD